MQTPGAHLEGNESPYSAEGPETPISSRTSQCVFQSFPPSQITASTSLTAFPFTALVLACSLPPYEGVGFLGGFFLGGFF